MWQAGDLVLSARARPCPFRVSMVTLEVGEGRVGYSLERLENSGANAAHTTTRIGRWWQRSIRVRNVWVYVSVLILGYFLQIRIP